MDESQANLALVNRPQATGDLNTKIRDHETVWLTNYIQPIEVLINLGLNGYVLARTDRQI